LITKADGTKFGKSESGNVWLDSKLTSPYKFYQFWLNASDEDAIKWIKIFTLLTKEEIEALSAQHNESPHLRILQKALAKDITIRAHSEEDYNTAIKASEILFGKSTTEDLVSLDESTFLSVMEGVPQICISKAELETSANVTDLLSTVTKNLIFSSKGEAKKMISAGGVSVNKVKISSEDKPTFELLNNKYLLVQKGKKNYFLILIE
jgi:tyrosyl-tRNA synthetase